jgi:predicted Zn-dependent peptidase
MHAPNDTHDRRLHAAVTLALALGLLAGPGSLVLAEENPAGAAAAKDTRPRHPGELKFETQEFEFRRTERVTLSNGMVLHLLEDHTLPIVDANAFFRGGAAFDPDGKEGLASLACSMVRAGGTTTLAADALDEELDFLAGDIYVGASTEACSAGFSFMSRDLERGIALFADVLRNPAFAAERFQGNQVSMAEGVRSQLQSPGGVLARATAGILQPGHAYAKVATEASIGSLTVEDLRAYHARWFHPEGFILSIAGDFKKDALVASLEKAFTGWEKSPEPLPKFPADTKREYRGGLHLIAMPGVTQTNLTMGHWGPKQNTKDRVLCDVMNLTLGGGSFWSRMTKVVRTKEGLAYSVFSRFGRGAAGGTFSASTQTKAETTYRAASLMKDLIEGIRAEPISAEEMEQARGTILNSFIRNFESPAALAAQYADLEFKEYPADWLPTYLSIVRHATIEDVQRVAKEYLRPENLEIILVGDPSLMDKAPEGWPEPNILAPK